VVVVGGGIAGIAAATALAERGVEVTLVEKHQELGGRVRSWKVPAEPNADGVVGADTTSVTMSRGFHAFFRQYYNLRSLLRRVDPSLNSLVAVPDYPLVLAGSHTDSFAGVPRTPPANLLHFVIRSRSFPLRDLLKVDVTAALELLDVHYPASFSSYDGVSAAEFLDRLRFPDGARHLALEVFARSFFAHPSDFSAGELVAMFHSYFVGSSEGLLFDVPTDDYHTVFWGPLEHYLRTLGADVRTGCTVEQIDGTDPASIQVLLSDATVITADAIVLAADPAALRTLVAQAKNIQGQQWRERIAATTNAPRFGVWRLWFDRPVRPERQAFLGTSGFGLLDNVTVLERFEAGAAQWAAAHHGSVVELHAYALPDGGSSAEFTAALRSQLTAVYPETADAQILAEQWLINADCPLIDTSPWMCRPEVTTADARIMLAGDGVRCDLPVALMERAATTGFQAANALLASWGAAGHDLWSVPLRGRVPGMGLARRASALRRTVGKSA